MEDLSIFFCSQPEATWNSVIAPIHDEFKRQGFDARWIPPPPEGEGDCYVFCFGSTFGPNEKSVYVFHSLGPGEGAPGSAPPVPKIMGQLLSGPYWLEQQRNRYPTEHHRLKMVGWPKSDWLFTPKRDKIEAEVRKELNLSPKRRTVLWGGSALNLPLLPKIRARSELSAVWGSLCEAKREYGFNLIIKPHCTYSGKLRGGPMDIPEDWKEMSQREDIIWIDPRISGDIFRLFVVADMLVCDFIGSICVEWLLMNKPQPFISFMDFGGADFEGEHFPVIEVEPEDMGAAVGEALDNPEVSEETEVWRKRMFYKPDGHASERAVNAILELLEVEK